MRYIYPDFIVEKVGSGYEVLLNDRAVPRVRISASCRRLLREGEPGADPDADAYLRDKLRSARWLLSALDRRRHTLIRVMRSIVAEQRGFFDHGVACLRPMTLSTIAGKVGLHESTVARVTHGKYAETPRGTFPLRFFFSGSLATELGEEVSARAVRERIRAIVAGEEPARPMSDDALARELGRQGIQIARRTVAKYREQLGIERSRDRGRRLAV